MKIGQYIGFIFFQRHCDPRLPEYDPYNTFEQQLSFVQRHGIPATFLLQYDALCDERYTARLQECSPQIEVGGWFEIVQELCEAADIPWRGREGYSWDWHADVGFSVGYTLQERRRLTDAYMTRFHAVFGRYPESFGSWAIDAGTLSYMHERYGVAASCNCRDQWGTDGYTLWGGYYGQAYYPSRRNMLCPAGRVQEQIDVPVFRMLGSDPIRQYDLGLESDDSGTLMPVEWQGVATLEPYYTEELGGGVPSWVDWYLQETFCEEGLGFHYAQAGQENSFPWDKVQEGLEYQIRQMKAMQMAGRVQFVTLGEIARRFRERYSLTPETSMTALTDPDTQKRRKSVWYLSRGYRLNLYAERERFWIRDLFVFDSQYPERYADEPCHTHGFVFDNLPVMDGNRFSGGQVRAGIYFYDRDGRQPQLAQLAVRYPADGGLLVEITDTIGQSWQVRSTENGITIGGPIGFYLRAEAGQEADFSDHTENEWHLCHEGYRYTVRLTCGAFSGSERLSCRLSSENGRIDICPTGQTAGEIDV